MTPDTIHLGGDEYGGWEKLDAALRLGSEAAEAGNYGATMRRLKEAIEAATEIGVYRSDGSWAAVAERIERVRTEMTGVTSAAFPALGFHLSGLLTDMHRSVVMLRVGRTRH